MHDGGAVDWDDLRYFVTVARAGTLSRAARELGVEHSTVGRRLDALERALGTRLCTRGPAGLVLTRAGHEMLDTAERLAELVRDIERRSAGTDARVAGTVRVTAPQSVDAYLMGELAALTRQHADLRLDVSSDDRTVDVRRGDADLALRFAGAHDPELITRRIGTGGWSLYASADYLARRGCPAAPYDLEGHDVVGFDQRLAATIGGCWLSRHGARARVVSAGSAVAAIARAVAAGLGLAPLPCFFASREPGLVRLTPELIGARDILLLAHPDLVRVARVRATMDFVIELFARDASVWSGATYAPSAGAAGSG